MIIACNAGNLGRIQQVVDAAIKLGRHIVFTGQDMDQIVETATRLKKLQIEDKKQLLNQMKSVNMLIMSLSSLKQDVWVNP